MPEVARAHQIHADRLQHYTVPGDRLLSILPYVRVETRLPVDLLFLTVNTREWTRTIDEYVKALYEWLTECLKVTQESASKEAKRQKWFYDRKVRAMELRPGDHVLVHLDAFQGQCSKLKN